MKYLFLLCIIILSSCSKINYFRKVTKEEKIAIRQSKRTVARRDSCNYVLIITTKGNMVVKLYNETPLHRDNFITKVKEGFYDSLMFHRVINNFMIQGGDPNSKNAKTDQSLGSGAAKGDRIPAEIRVDQHIYHERGAIAAARTNNPAKESSNCQFYLVQKPAFRQSELDSNIAKRNLTLNEEQKTLYTSKGGTPHLDGNYTVFGEMTSGLAVLDSIAFTKTNKSDRPEKDIQMKMFVIHSAKKK
jgi:peptidyl-prolyl cis-trans isomerase B (cyclophilin B)